MSGKQKFSDVIFVYISGIGTSQGVPIIGMDYPPEFLANPKNHRTRPSIYVATDEVKLAVDTPPDFRTQICGRKSAGWTRSSSPMPTRTISWAWTIAGGFAICAAARRCRFMPTRRPWTALQRVFIYAFHAGPWPKGYFIPEPHIVEGPFTLGDLEITPLPLPHGRTVTNGYLLVQDGKKRLAYLSDCKEVPVEVVKKIARRGGGGAGRVAAQHRIRRTCAWMKR